jgi:hypothetical protein
MIKAKNIKDINNLIVVQVQESLHLDYKSSDAIDGNKKVEISKDVSAFANSDGGSIVYGITEAGHLPVTIDAGVDHKKYSREWIEQVINSNVFPKIEGVKIIQIPISADRSVYIINIPKSYRGPHQASDKKYYRRYNFQSVPMENYEIEDVRSRALPILPILHIDAVILEHNIVHLELTNISAYPAIDVKFKFVPELVWHNDEYYPRIFSHGAKFVAPGKKLTFFYHTYIDIVNNPNIPKSFDVHITYKHPITDKRITDKFHVDFMDFFSSVHVKTDTEENTEVLKKGLNEIKSGLSKISSHLEDIAAIAESTGLRLSLKTLINLHHIMAKENKFEKLDPYFADASVFREVLGVDIQLAHQLAWHFGDKDSNKKISEIAGINEEVIDKLHEFFEISDKA